MKFRIKKKVKMKPGMWPGSRVPATTKSEKVAPREEQKYRWKSANEIEESEWVVGWCNDYVATITGARDAEGRVEIEGKWESGDNVGKHFVHDYQPFRINKERVKQILERYEVNGAKTRAYYAKSSRGSAKAAKKEQSSKETAIQVDEGRPKLRLKLKFKKKLKLKLRRAT